MKKKLNLLLMAVAFAATASAQQPGWLHKDLKADSVFGISADKAYKELLKGKKPKQVIVAVIDAGADYKHEDLKDVIWKNKKEIAGNGKDDDKNGYADDVYGWNFLGSAKGSVMYDNMEIARIVKSNPNSPLKDTLAKKVNEARMNAGNIAGFQQVLNGVVAKLGTTPDSTAFKNFKSADGQQAQVARIIYQMMQGGATYPEIKDGIASDLKHFEDELKYNLNVDYNSRDTVGDNYADVNEKIYGNAVVDAPDCDHGTHVSGIIAAKRGNGLGIDGIADAALILPVRAVPTGDERDKDIANAIYYAVNNGAKVINMSFGKGYSPEKEAVDKAVKYAVSKDVLFVHAAGNDAKNVDVENNFPRAAYLNTGDAAANWIEVGASGWSNDESLPASFSNFGAKTVDVFAPGVKINSTTPGSKYADHDGTSMASPVVAGIAALVREYYPALTASQVKEIIVKSVVKVNYKVKKPGTDDLVDFTDLCSSGGVVNAYDALVLAAKYAKGQVSK
ncbi:S8 family peptidase [Pedobacter sp. GR22-6]|uniref:S8 family peptidase n=1 Tax=Pedobacter sp. GR22-6 TaxID=3127957 RepID=UPI00307E9BDA